MIYIDLLFCFLKDFKTLANHSAGIWLWGNCYRITKNTETYCIAYILYNIIVSDRSQCLLSQFWHSECTILLGTTWSQGCKARHEEVQAWERHQVYSNLTQVTIQLSRETETASDTAHRSRDQMIQITIGWCSQFQGTETNIVQSFIV